MVRRVNTTVSFHCERQWGAAAAAAAAALLLWHQQCVVQALDCSSV